MSLNLFPLLKWVYRGVLVAFVVAGLMPSVNVDLNYYWPVILGALVLSFVLLIGEHEFKRRVRNHPNRSGHRNRRISE